MCNLKKINVLTTQEERAAKAAIGSLHAVTQGRMVNLRQLLAHSAHRHIKNQDSAKLLCALEGASCWV